jgi:hypothetical protein
MNQRPTIEHVAHDQFDSYRWWEPQRFRRDPRWFYGTLQGAQRSANTARPDTLDTPLIPLVQVLTRAGLATLPSCSGHFPTEGDLRALHRGLEYDANFIRSIGLTLRCTEDGSMIVLRDPLWLVPSYEDWVGEVRKYRGVGRIGVLFSRGDSRLAEVQASLSKLSNVGVCEKKSPTVTTLTILTRATTERERDQLWLTVAQRVGHSLRG